MPNINPISNTEDILKEANANMTQVTEAPVPAEAPDPSIAVLIDTPQSVESPLQVNSQPVPTAPLIVPPQLAVNRIVEVDDVSTFNYRLPVFSYVLVWFYIIAAVVIGGFLAYFLNIISEYSSSSYYSSSSTSSVYNSIIYPLSLVVAGCIAVVVSLLNNTKIYRYVAIGVSVVLVGFEIYGVYRLTTSMSSYYSFSDTISMYFSYYGVFILPLNEILPQSRLTILIQTSYKSFLFTIIRTINKIEFV